MSKPAARELVFRYAQASHRGLVREQNEDAVAIAEEAGFALVADGMGGYNAGEVASGLTADFLLTHLSQDLDHLRHQTDGTGDGPSRRMLHSLLRARIDGVNEAIIDAANRNPHMQGMGTTLAMLLFSDKAVTTLHLGDSRIYRLRDEALSLLTRDHSLLQEQIDAGVLTPGEARFSLNRNFVTRALGVDVSAEPEINEYDLVAGDLYLICSDGLPDMLSDEEIYDVVCGEPSDGDGDFESDGYVADVAALKALAAKLVDAANGHGGRDNVSVVLASVGRTREARRRDAGGEAREQGGARRR
jgi:PPM family protein phosphatase